MTSKRRWILIIGSVGAGTFLSALLIQSRLGTLNKEALQQLGINFAFAVAIVVVIGILFSKRKKGNEEEK